MCNGVKSILPVEFCDVTKDSLECSAITKEEADKIAQFILCCVGKGCDDYIIHCDAGMHRSADVARSLELFIDLPERDATYWHGNISNSLVFRMAFHTLMVQSGRKKAQRKTGIISQ